MTWWQNFFYGSSEEEKVDPLIAEFEEDGFSYNEVDDNGDVFYEGKLNG